MHLSKEKTLFFVEKGYFTVHGGYCIKHLNTTD